MLQLLRSSWSGVLRTKRYPKDVRYLFELFAHLSSLTTVHLPRFFLRRPRLCLDMVSSGGLSRLPRSRYQGTLGTLLGPLPERRLYLSSDAPQILTVWSSLPLARDLASGLHVTAFTSLKAFKSGRRGCRKTIVLKSTGNGCEKFTRSARAGSTRTDPCWCSRS